MTKEGRTGKVRRVLKKKKKKKNDEKKKTGSCQRRK
jgi:hypothetical protein